jgi:hypothetical protein
VTLLKYSDVAELNFTDCRKKKVSQCYQRLKRTIPSVSPTFIKMSKPSTVTGDIKAIIKTLIQHPSDFGPEQAAQAMHAIMAGHATPSQISAFLIGLKLNQKDLDAEIVAACADTMRDFALQIHYSDHRHLEDCVVDIVGTGGDGHDTYNVSTTASLVAAGAGAKVAKVRFG